MSAHDVLFPDEISMSSSFGPTFKTLVTELPSGKEQRIPVREQARHRIEIQLDTQDLDDLYAIKEFAILRQGSAFGFRIRDRSDYNTTASGRAATDSLGTAHTKDDQNIGTGNGTNLAFQLTKRYSDGIAPNIVRNITKPRASTVLIAVNGVLQTLTTHYSFDDTTGIVLFVTAPPNTEAVTWGGEFDTPVRFDQSVEEFLAINITDFDNGNLGTLTCLEIIDEVTGLSDFFPGGSATFSFGVSAGVGNAAIGIGNGLTKVIVASFTGLSVFLPDDPTIATWPLGEYFTIIGGAGTEDFEVIGGGDMAIGVETWGNTVFIAAVAAGEIYRISLIINAAGDRTWMADS